MVKYFSDYISEVSNYVIEKSLSDQSFADNGH